MAEQWSSCDSMFWRTPYYGNSEFPESEFSTVFMNEISTVDFFGITTLTKVSGREGTFENFSSSVPLIVKWTFKPPK